MRPSRRRLPKFVPIHKLISLILYLRINGIVEEYGIFQKVHVVVRDNAANMVSALGESIFDHVGCFLHILQVRLLP